MASEPERLDPGIRRRLDVAITLIGLPLVSLYGRLNVDDPFITFRYAWNFASGNGLVFNPGERILGTTSPLFALLLGFVSDDVVAIPLIAHAASGAALIGVALLVSRLAARDARESGPVAAVVAPIIVLTSPLLAETQGFELNLFMLAAFAGIAAHLRDRPGWSGFCLALAALFRGDGLVVAAVVGIRLLLAGGNWKRFAVAFALPLVPFLAAAWQYYGWPLPNTLSAKRAMGDSGLWRGYVYGGVRLAGLYAIQSPLYVLVAPVVIAGLAWIRSNRLPPATALVVAWTSVVFAAYAAMGIPSAFNYYGMFVPLVGLLAAFGTRHLVDRYRRGFVLPAVLAVIAAAQLWPSRQVLREEPKPRYAAYRACGEDLAVVVPDSAAVAMVEIGILSHFSGRRIVDLVGLVHPEIGPHLADGDVTWPVRAWTPEYVLLHDPPWASIETGLVAADWFARDYRRVKTYAGAEPYRLALYERKP